MGVLAAAAWSLNRGADLDQDPEYQARLQDPKFRSGLERSLGGLRRRGTALSADVMDDQRQRARAAGFQDYWLKPIDVRQLRLALEKLRRALGEER